MRWQRLTAQLVLLALVATPGPSSVANAQTLARDVTQDTYESARLILPYAFYSDSLRLAGGVAGGRSANFSETDVLFGALMATTNRSFAALGSASGVRVPWTRRFFLEGVFSLGRYTDQRLYGSRLPFDGPNRPGSNGSDPDDFISGEGRDDWAFLRLQYILPLGAMRDDPVARYVLDKGLLVEGATGTGAFNPLNSGRTKIELEPFYQRRSFDEDEDLSTFAGNGLRLRLDYDNTDFIRNPSRGSHVKLTASHDFGALDSDGSWTTWEIEGTTHVDLGSSWAMRQNVLALNAWTIDTPSWQVEERGPVDVIDGRPPPFEGASLGGFFRMRAYPSDRFNDRAALYYSAEMRMIPAFNPLKGIAWLEPFDIDWIQLVPFVELGRVAPDWDLVELHKDLQWDVGTGLRFMAERSVLRLDLAVGPEGFGATAMVAHPF